MYFIESGQRAALSVPKCRRIGSHPSALDIKGCQSLQPSRLDSPARDRRRVARSVGLSCFLMASHNIPNKFMRQRVYIIKFLKKFRYSPCLWNKQMPNFNDKRAKQEAVDSLIALGIRYDFVYSSASVKKKLRMYKNMFKRMQQRVRFMFHLYGVF